MLRLSSTNLSSGLYSSVSVGDTKQWECIKGVNRTLGDCKASHAEYVAAGVKMGEVNQYYNYLELPIDIM